MPPTAAFLTAEMAAAVLAHFLAQPAPILLGMLSDCTKVKLLGHPRSTLRVAGCGALF